MIKHFAMPEERNYFDYVRAGPLPRKTKPRKPVREEKIRPTPQENGEVNQRITLRT
jgi:hypothetical protein